MIHVRKHRGALLMSAWWWKSMTSASAGRRITALLDCGLRTEKQNHMHSSSPPRHENIVFDTEARQAGIRDLGGTSVTSRAGVACRGRPWDCSGFQALRERSSRRLCEKDLKGLWRNGSACDSRSEGWELESLWPHFHCFLMLARGMCRAPL